MKIILSFLIFIITFNIPILVGQTNFPSYYVSDNIGHSVAGPIISPGSGSVIVSASIPVFYKSGKSISLLPGFNALAVGSGSFSARLDFQVAVIEATSTTPNISVGIYEKLELGLVLPPNIESQIDNFLAGGTGINPYDPAEISIEAIFTPPSGGGSAKKIYGFFYKEFTRPSSTTTTCNLDVWTEVNTDYKWRVRFAPNFIGNNWTASIQVVIPGSTTLQIDGISFNCITSSNKGPLVVASNNGYLQYKKNNEQFFAFGSNIPYPNVNPWDTEVCNTISSYENVSGTATLVNLETAKPSLYQQNLNLMQDLLDNDGNFVRVGIGPWNYACEWDQLGNYDKRQMHAWELDRVFELAHNNGASNELYIMLFLEDGGKFKINSEYGFPLGYAWPGNPYNSVVNNNMISGIVTPKNFFDPINTVARTYYKKKLRYFMARYGYSMNLAVMDVLSEMDDIGASYGSNGKDTSSTEWYSHWSNLTMRNDVKNWLLDMVDYMQSTTSGKLGYSDVLYSTSFAAMPLETASDPYLDSKIKVTSHHYYNDNRNIHHYRSNVSNHYRTTYGKPFIFGELGVGTTEIQACTDLEFHNNLWATAMAGSFGTGLNWMGWDYSNYPNQLNDNLPALSSFINNAIGSVGSTFINPIPKKYPTGQPSNTSTPPVECFALTAGSTAIGWVHNRSNYWGNYFDLIDPGGSCYSSTYNSSFLATNEDDSFTSSTIITCGASNKITLGGFNTGYAYGIDWYSTRGSSSVYLSSNVSTTANSAGEITFCYPSLHDGVDTNPPGDYAFIASPFVGRSLTLNNNEVDKEQNEINSDASGNIISVELMPNPNDGLFNIHIVSSTSNKEISIEICDVIGNKIWSMNNVILDKKINVFSFNLEKERKGLYFLKISGKEIIMTKKIIKQ